VTTSPMLLGLGGVITESSENGLPIGSSIRGKLRIFHREMPFDQITGTLAIPWQVHQILTGGSSCQGISSTCPSNFPIVVEGT